MLFSRLATVFAIGFGVASYSFADEATSSFSSQQAKRARKGYQAAVEREKKQFQSELRKLRIKYSSELEDAVKTATRAGDFEEAQRIQTEKDRVDAILKAAADRSSKAVIERLTSRKWYRFTPGEPTLVAKFLKNGKLDSLNRTTSFTEWSYRDGILTLRNPAGGEMEFIPVHDDVFAAPDGAPHAKHVSMSPRN